jgi:polyadenylate-binding protein
VKNFDESIDEVKLGELFAKFGELTSVKIKTDSNGNSLGFGFVSFRVPDDALRAVKEMHEFVLNERKLYVSRFQKKSERLSELKKRFELRKFEKLKRFEGLNLFVKNLDDKFDDERLRAEFSHFGTITSAKVMTENGVSKGFGFVCYSQPEEAMRALSQLNGRIVGSKPLYIALAQRKEDRRKILTAQFRERLQNAQLFSQQQQQMNNVNPNLFYTFPNGQPALNNPALMSRFVPPSQVNAQFQTYQNGFQRASVPRWQVNNSLNYLQNQQQPQQQYVPTNTKPNLNLNTRNVSNMQPKPYSKYQYYYSNFLKSI